MTLTNQELVYILTTDPILGTTADAPNTPTGAYNRELSKLIANDLELEAAVNAVAQRTYGAESGSDAPDPLPVSPVNAPAEPADGAIHITYYDDFEIVVQWDGSVWNEVFRVARVGGGSVYAEVNTGSGASVGTVSGTTLASLVSGGLKAISAEVIMSGDDTLTTGNVNQSFVLLNNTLTVTDAGFSLGDRFIGKSAGTVNLNGDDWDLENGDIYVWQHNGTSWFLLFNISPSTTYSTVANDGGSTAGIVSASVVEEIAAGVTTTIRKREVVDVDANGYAAFSLPRAVGGVSMSAENIASVIGVQDATVDGDSFVNDVKTLHVRIAADGSNFAVHWVGAAADDQVAITYLK